MNEIIAESKQHYGSYSQMKRAYTSKVAWEAKVQKILAFRKADFVITWFVRNRRKNKDNIMAGQKFIFDGLQSAGIIENDGWKQLRDVVHRFEVDNRNPRVEVEIIEVPA
jgi:Holliday junction resolvase RusA-like endonuclease